MKSKTSQILLCSMLGCALATAGAAQGRRGGPGGPPPGPPAMQAGTYSKVSGAISQLNYDRDAEVEGFLLNNNTLVHLPPRAANSMGVTMRKGDNVEIAGFAQTAPSGLQTIEAQSIQDRTSGKTLTVPQPGAAAPFSGSGRIEQLNYGADGAVNGFILQNGTLATVPPFSASNPSSIRVGATISYSGYARSTMSGRTVVDVQTLSVNGQALTMAPAGPAGGPDGPPSPPLGSGPGPVDGPGGPAGPGAPPPPPPSGAAPPPPPPNGAAAPPPQAR